jgi:4-amino-4-deoxy-L-arabinose transferase-like glycosyltransferase
MGTILLLVLSGLLVRVALGLVTPEGYLSWEASENYLLRARAVLDGQIPYRDFWESKPPLWTYTFALWGRVFGVSVLSLKMLIAAAEMAFVVLLYGFGRFLIGQRLAFYAALSYTFLPQVLFVSAIEGKYESLTFIFLVGGLWLLLRGRLLAGGAILGIGMAYKFNIALGVLAGAFYLATTRGAGSRRAALFVVISILVFLWIISPFLAVSPQEFFDFTVKNFATGRGHHLIQYKAISLWGVFLRTFHIEAPAFLPFLFQLGLIGLLVWTLGKRQSASRFTLVFYGYIFTTAYLLFIRVGNIQYFNWALPFLVLIFWKLWDRRSEIKGVTSLLVLMVIQTLLVPYTWKNWTGTVAGPLLVITTLGLTGYILLRVVRIAISEDPRGSPGGGSVVP